MKDKNLICYVVGCLTIAFIFGAGLYGCSEANTRYYEAQKDCVTNGGSWVASRASNSYSADCLRVK